METSRFPNKLKAFRLQKGYSRKKMARMLGLADPSMLSRWERGVSMPSIVQVFRLARIYNTYPHELFDELWLQYEDTGNLLTLDEGVF
jgi:transcriptional regulator with XRE-family HTH domain